jgi:hypothetical protein
MKAMLEARIVAASVQRPRDFEHGVIAGRDRITFSSQGSWMSPHILASYDRQAIAALTPVFQPNIRKTRRWNSSTASVRQTLDESDPESHH